MNRLRSIFSTYALIGLVFFGFAADTNAQSTRNSRETRNLVRQSIPDLPTLNTVERA